MPSTVASLFESAGVRESGSVGWGQPLSGDGTTGVYVVALADPMATAPIFRPAVERLLAVRPELAVDRRRPTAEELIDRLATMWCADETVLYVGLAGPRVSRSVSALAVRVGEYYATPLGARTPHSGGWPLKTLAVLDRLRVHYAYCDRVRDVEATMLDAFAAAATPGTRASLPAGPSLPFANLQDGHGRRPRHGITGAREPRHAAPPTQRRPTASRADRAGGSVEVTAEQLAARLGISGKTLRAWLRARHRAGDPLLTEHVHQGAWRFSASTAATLEAGYRQRR